MSVAIPTVTRLQDQHDVNVTPGAGVDTYALCWDNASGKFVLSAAYALLAGRAGGQTLYGGTGANEDITIHGTSNATRTTSYVVLQPTAGNVGIGTTAPGGTLTVSRDGVSFTIEDGGATVANFSAVYPAFSSTTIFALRRYGAEGGNQLIGLSGNGSSPALYFCGNIGAAATSQPAVVFDAYKWNGATSRQAIGAAELAHGFWNNFVALMSITGGGNVGIGTTAPATLLHAVSTTATTNALRNVLTLGANVTGAGAGDVGLGAAILFTAETTTTVDTSMARIQAITYEATHATRKYDLVGTAYDTAEREGWRVRGNGSEPAIGFYGVAPIARAILATGAGATADNIITALQNLGLVKQS